MGYTHRWRITPLQGYGAFALNFDGLHPSLADYALSGLWVVCFKFRWATPIAGGLRPFRAMGRLL